MSAPHALSRAVYLRLLGAVGLCAFTSLGVQVRALVGSRGIVPAARLFEQPPTWASFLDRPSLFWWNASDTALVGACAAGALACLGVVLRLAPRALLLLAWALYLSLFHAGGPFLSFQWDTLLLETLLLSAFYAPASLRFAADRPAPAHDGARWLVRLLLFRLMLGAGVVKLTSGDPHWRDLTALDFHFWTQPLPGPLSSVAQGLPPALLKAATAATFVVEGILPFGVFGPPRVRAWTAAGFAALQLAILATGNYGFFNLLTLALCVPLLDDAVLLRWVPARWRQPEAASPVQPARWRRVLGGAAVGTIGLLGLAESAARCGVERPGLLAPALRALSPWASLNGYGLFATMTTERGEIRVEGSADGVTWREFPLPWKPGDPSRRPPLLLGHMPRLDWQLWFAALGGCRKSGWLVELQRGLLRGDSDARALFAEDPFPDTPPRFVRTLRAPYRFSTSAERSGGAPLWDVGPARPFCPVLALEGGQLRAVAGSP
ncbi:MAG: hypothetical protein RL653_1792 [Pseudomonadota bacterium]|jgi:hypothetical protein